VAWGAVILFKLLYFTLRKDVRLADSEADPYAPVSGRTFTFCVWHDSLLSPLFIARQPATMALVGGHRDGTFLANSLRNLGITTARGSTSAGGTAAVRELMQEGQNRHLVLTPDGPRGPRREMKTGCAFLAAKTQKPVVPTAFVCTRSWSIGTGWTDLTIPVPFSKVLAITAPAIEIPRKVSKEELEQWTAKIQQEMDALQIRAAEMIGKTGPAAPEQSAARKAA